MNRKDVDYEWLLCAVLLVLGFAFADVPTTPVEYVTSGVVLVGAFLAAVDPIRERPACLPVLAATFLGAAAVSYATTTDAPNDVVRLGLDGMFALLFLTGLLGESYRRRRGWTE